MTTTNGQRELQSTLVISDWASNLSSKAHRASVIGDQSDQIEYRSHLDVLPDSVAPELSLRPPCSLTLKVFHFFLSLVSYIYGLMGMSFSLRLSVSLFIWRLKANESLSLSLSLWDFIWLLSFTLSLY